MLEFLDLKTSMLIVGSLVALALYRFFFQKKSSEQVALEKEYQEILTTDKYKVKGQW